MRTEKEQITYKTILRARLPGLTSIYTAELYAILGAYSYIQESSLEKAIIVSDSKSALLSLTPLQVNYHHIIAEIINIHNGLPEEQVPMLLWVPSHSEIPGNDRADLEANKAARLPTTIQLPPTTNEFFPKIKEHIRMRSQIFWDHTKTQLKTIHPKLELWSSSNQNSKLQEKCLIRIRIGHSQLTHSYLIKQEPRPRCTCSDTPLTIKHVLLSCQKYDTQRQVLTIFCHSHQIDFNLKNLLGNDFPELISLLFDYLKETDLLPQI